MAELDTRLPLLVKPVEIQDPTDALMRVGQLRGQQSQQQLRDLQIAEAQRQVAEQQQLRSLGAESLVTDPATGTVTFDPKKYIPGLAKVNPQLAIEQQHKLAQQDIATKKAGVEGQKAQLELGKGQLELHLQQLGVLEGLLSGVRDQASYDAAKMQFKQMFPTMPLQAPAQYDPQWLRGLSESLVDKKTRIELGLKEAQTKEALTKAGRPDYGFGDATDAQLEAMFGPQIRQQAGRPTQEQVELALRAQDARAVHRDVQQFEATMPGRVQVAQASRAPQVIQTEGGYARVNPDTGAVEPITQGGEPLRGKPTEAESAAMGFGGNAQAADAIATRLEQQGISSANPQAMLGNVPGVGNYLLSPELQQYNQAKTAFVTAVLRKESGAAIGKEEYVREEKKYFPVPGDTPAAIQQKAEARQRAIQMLGKQSGRPLPQSGQGGQQQGGGGRTLTLDTVRGLAKKRGVSVDQVIQDAEAAGFQVR